MLVDLILTTIRIFFTHCKYGTVLLLFCYETVFKTWNHFSDLGLKFVRGVPFFGLIGELIFGNRVSIDVAMGVYNKYPREQVIGIYDLGGRPIYFIRDPNMVMDITVRNFDHFAHRRKYIDENAEPMLGKALFFMRAPKWKNMRQILEPAFTGDKMKSMFAMMNDYNRKYVERLRRMINDGGGGGGDGGGGVDFELGDLFTRYSIDIIANCAFGIDVDSAGKSDNEFYQAGRYLTTSTMVRTLKLMAYMRIPQVMRFFNVKVIDTLHRNYFRDLVLEAMHYRQKNGMVRHDIIDLLMITRNCAVKTDEKEVPVPQIDFGKAATIEKSLPRKVKPEIKWDDDDFVAQCVMFFFAGFDSVATLFTFMAHELAVNVEIQDRLYREIKNVERLLDNKIPTDDVLDKMKYMDMVVLEMLRKWNPTILIDRVATKPYNLRLIDGTKIPLVPGDCILIPAYCFHMDPQYFIEPQLFDPERFNYENASRIIPGTFIPFGVGPRKCIGAKFALLEAKALFYHLLLNFKLERCTKTIEPVKLKAKTFKMVSAGDFWIKLTPRTVNYETQQIDKTKCNVIRIS